MLAWALKKSECARNYIAILSMLILSAETSPRWNLNLKSQQNLFKVFKNQRISHNCYNIVMPSLSATHEKMTAYRWKGTFTSSWGARNEFLICQLAKHGWNLQTFVASDWLGSQPIQHVHQVYIFYVHKGCETCENAVHQKAGLLLTQLVETLHLKHGRVEVAIRRSDWGLQCNKYQQVTGKSFLSLDFDALREMLGTKQNKKTGKKGLLSCNCKGSLKIAVSIWVIK